MIHAHTITLTPSEILIASTVGAARYMENVRTQRYQGHGLTADPLHTHINGALGEAAFAKARGVYWNGDIGNLTAPDVGGWQVRTTPYPDGKLIIRRLDDDDAPYVLVRGQCPTFAIVGWILARLAKCPEWLEADGRRPPAYFVPAAALQPFALYSEHEPPPALFEDDRP